MKEKLVLHLDFLYLCNAFGDALRVKAAAQHSSSELGSAFTLHRSCIVNEDKNLRPHERNFSRPREKFFSPTGEIKRTS